MPYSYCADDNTADVAFEAWAEDLDILFRDSGNAVINVMIENPVAILPRETHIIEILHEQIDLLLFNFLDQLIFFKDSAQLLLIVQNARVSQRDLEWHLSAIVSGETIDPSRHHLIVDVKAVTLHNFLIEKIDNAWRAHVVLDI